MSAQNVEQNSLDRRIKKAGLYQILERQRPHIVGSNALLGDF